ncbi:MAG: hypothetical protein FWG73_03715 [Planctomycetaceae bacterium]|nr:hypothetical protein [Planctomycetaceae bacterium]
MNPVVEKLAAIEREVSAIQPKMAPLTERIADLDKKVADFAQQITGIAEESAAVKHDIELTQQSLTRIQTLISESKTESEQLVAGQEENLQRCETMTAVFGAAFQAVSQFFETAQRMGLADQAKAVFLSSPSGEPLPSLPEALSAALTPTASTPPPPPEAEAEPAESIAAEPAVEEPAAEEPVAAELPEEPVVAVEPLPEELVAKDEFSVKYVLDSPDSDLDEPAAAVESAVEPEPMAVAEPIESDSAMDSIAVEMPSTGISDADLPLPDSGPLDSGLLDADLDDALSGVESAVAEESMPSWSTSGLPNVATPPDMIFSDAESADTGLENSPLEDSALEDADLVMGASSFATDALPDYLPPESFESEPLEGEEAFSEPASDLEVSPLNLSVPALPEPEALPPEEESEEEEEIEAMLATMMTPITATAGG